MKNVPEYCVEDTNDSIIKLQEKRSIIRFHNPQNRTFKRVQVDGCALTEGIKCDNMLCSHDEREEWFVELKGSELLHAIEQIKATIQKLGEYNDNRHSLIVCTRVMPQITTKIQKAKKEFHDCFHSSLLVKVTPLDISLY